MTQNTLEKDLVDAVEDAKSTLVDFRSILLGDGPDEVDPAWFHFEWSDILLNGKENYAIQGFRQSAKGQYVLRSFPLYCLRYPEKTRDYIVIVKQNAALAQAKLLEIENEYLTNPAMKSNLVEVVHKSGKVFEVNVVGESGEIINVRIEAYGKGSSIRGLDNQNRRPRIVIIDDPQDLEDSLSDTVMDADWKWFLDDVCFLGKHTRIFLIGNNLGEKCIIERVFDNAADLKFKAMRIAIVNEDGTPSWPGMFDAAFIEDERESYRRLQELDVWIRERMCQAINEESRCVTKDDLGLRYSHVYLNNILNDSAITTCLDPASSTEKTACYRAIVTVACRKDVHGAILWYVLNIRYGRWTSDVLMKELFEEVCTYHPRTVGIERGMYKDVIQPFIHQEMLRTNTMFHITPIEHAKVGSKLERVKMLGPRFKAKGIWLPESAPWLAEFEAEMLGVTKDGFKSLFTDLVDTLAMQQQIAVPPTNSGREHNERQNAGQPLVRKDRDPFSGKRVGIPHISRPAHTRN